MGVVVMTVMAVAGGEVTATGDADGGRDMVMVVAATAMVMTEVIVWVKVSAVSYYCCCSCIDRLHRHHFCIRLLLLCLLLPLLPSVFVLCL